MVSLLTSEAQEASRINFLTALTAVAGGGEAGVRAAVEAGAVQAIVASCSASAGEHLQQVAAEAVCQIGTEPSTREGLVAAGAVPALASLLPTPSFEVRVRALMALGMLVPSSADAQEALAQAPGALEQVMALMKQEEDADCHVIARDLFVLLGQNPATKDSVEAALRAVTAGAVAMQQ